MRHRVKSRRTTTTACALAVVASTAVAATLAAGAPAASDATRPTRGGTLTIGIPEQFKGFDPYALIGRRDYQALQSMCDTLFTYGPNYAPQGMLVERWS